MNRKHLGAVNPRQCLRKHTRRRRGAAAVEFAVVAPVFIMLVLASIEFAHVFMIQHLLVNASREGARNAVTSAATIEDVQTQVVDYLADLGIHGIDVSVTSAPATTPIGQPIAVQVSVAFDQVSWLPSPQFFAGTVLAATTEMRREGPG